MDGISQAALLPTRYTDIFSFSLYFVNFNYYKCIEFNFEEQDNENFSMKLK